MGGNSNLYEKNPVLFFEFIKRIIPPHFNRVGISICLNLTFVLVDYKIDMGE